MNKATLEAQSGLTVGQVDSGAGNRSVRLYATTAYGDLVPTIFSEPYTGGSKHSNLTDAIGRLNDQFWSWTKNKALIRDAFRCKKCQSSQNLSVDHVVNRSQGGTHAMGNLQTLCMTCHQEKTDNV